MCVSNLEFNILPVDDNDAIHQLQQKYLYIEEKVVLDLVNGIGTVAKDLNENAKKREKGFSRLWDDFFGDSKKRQNQINENVIEGLKAASIWLQDHDRHISRIDMRIKDIADILYETRNEIVQFYREFENVSDRVALLENFKKNADGRFALIEEKLARIEAQQQIDREVENIGFLNLPLELEIFTVLDNLASGEFGIWYTFTSDKQKQEELKYLKNKIKSKIGKQKINDWIDFYELYNLVRKLDKKEQKAIAFISAQYRQFNRDPYYDGIDLIKLLGTSKNYDEFEEAISSKSHIRTYFPLEEFIEDMAEYMMDT